MGRCLVTAAATVTTGWILFVTTMAVVSPRVQRALNRKKET